MDPKFISLGSSFGSFSTRHQSASWTMFYNCQIWSYATKEPLNRKRIPSSLHWSKPMQHLLLKGGRAQEDLEH